MNLDFEEGMDVLRLAYEKTAEDRLYARWITGYDKEMNFTTFKQKVKGKQPVKHTQESTEETLNKVEKILGMRVNT